MELHEGSGRRASVDFCVILTDESGKMIGRIPGEAKSVIELRTPEISETTIYTEGLLLLSTLLLIDITAILLP